MPKQQKINRIKSTILLLLLICLSSFPAFAASPTLLQCDINNDGLINTSDLVEMSNHMGATGTPGWITEDVDKNGIIQVCDLMFIANNYGTTVGTTSGTTSGTTGGTTGNGVRIQKLSIAYSDALQSTTNQNFIATHFDMANCGSASATYAKNVKALNPNIKLITYYDSLMASKTASDWSTVNSHEDWFVHSLSGGRIERNVYPGQYLMNPNSGWSNYLAQRIKTALTSNTVFDGVFLDDCAGDLEAGGYTFKVSYSQFGTGVLTNWATSMKSHMLNLKTTLGSKIVMANCYKFTTLADQTKCMLWENFMHGRSKTYNENGYSLSDGILAINSLHDQATKGNIIATNSGCSGGTTAQKETWAKFCYACLAFAVVDLNKAYFSWEFYNTDSNHGYYSMMDTNLGSPIGDYYKVSGTAQVYARQFANYYVAANLNLLGTGSVTFTLNGASRTLAPRTAVFIPK